MGRLRRASRRDRRSRTPGKLKLPEQYASSDDPLAALQRSTIEASYAHVGVDIEDGANTSGVSVGIVDSTLDPPDDLSIDVRRSNDCRPEAVGTTDDSAAAHGKTVTRIVAAAAPDAAYSLYRAVDGVDAGGGEYGVGDLLPAIHAAVADGVDVLNVSVGVDSRYGGQFSYERAVEDATEQGTTLVAAAGNEGSANRVCYPALAEGAISVAGCVVRCDRPVGDHVRDARLWLGDPRAHDGPYCSRRGCSSRTDCHSDHRSVGWWVGNVPPDGDDPTVAAPCYAVVTDGIEKEGHGTSFAAPVVTGVLARLTARRAELSSGSELAERLRDVGENIGYDHLNEFQRVLFRNPRS